MDRRTQREMRGRRRRVRAVTALALFALLDLSSLPRTAAYVNGDDLPGPSAHPETIPTGSLVIPMDTTSQNLGMFKAYGLVYKLLQSNIPVYWLILDGKTFNGVDFSVNANNFYTGAVVGAPYNYTGGPFVIDQ